MCKLTSLHQHPPSNRISTNQALPFRNQHNNSTPDLAGTYDDLGRLETVTQNSIQTAQYGYTNLLPTSETATHDGIAKTLVRHYDDIGRPRSIALGADYTTAYGHDTAGRINRVWHHPELDTDGLPQGAPHFTYGYLTSAPHLIETVAGPAHTVTRIHDPARDVIKKIENRKLDSTLVSAYEYTVNPIGQRTQVLTTGTAFNGVPGDWDWDYDSMGQLTTAEASTPANSRGYEYDAIGNRKFSETSNTVISDPPVAATATYTSNPLNQYDAISGGGFQPPGPTYDLDGNETSGPVPGAAGNTPGVQPPAHATDLQWDAENRLVSATIGIPVPRTPSNPNLTT